MPEGKGGVSTPGAPLYTGLRPLRTFCMLSIVAYHTSWSWEDDPDPLLGVAFGLTTLQVILCSLVAGSSREPALSSFVQRRARRLLRPWLLWSVFYLVVQIAESLRYGHEWDARIEPSAWLIGGSGHLWFLPYGFVVSVLALLATRACRGRLAVRGACVAALSGSVLLLFAEVLGRSLQPPPPLRVWLEGLPALAFGVAIGRALSIRDLSKQRLLLVGTSLVALLPLLLGSHVVSSSHLWPRYAVAVPLACLGFTIPFPEFRLLTWLAEVNMGVYLVHMFALQVTKQSAWLVQTGGLLHVASVYLLSVAIISTLPLLLWVLRGQRSAHEQSTMQAS